MNRIPVNVNVNADSPTSASTNYQQQQQQEQQQSSNKYNSSSEYRSSSTSNKSQQQSSSETSATYNMRNMNDETDRIRERMREFEEHCRRVREQAFANSATRPTSTTTTSGQPGFFTDFGGTGLGSGGGGGGFDQRVPLSSIENGGSRFGSSMHRSSIEDQPDGSKKYRIEFDIGDFYQNELHIATNGKTLVVKGEREQKVGSATETKTFNRELTLPDYVDVDRMNAFLLNNNTNANASSASPSSSSAQFRTSQTQLVSQSAVNNVLVVEAPIIMDKYTYRRSVFDQSNKSQSPIRTSHHASSPKYPSSMVGSSSRLNQNGAGGSTTSFYDQQNQQQQQQRYENRSSSSSTTHQKVTRSTSGTNLLGSDEFGSGAGFRPASSSYTSQSNLNQSMSPELIPGYPLYDAAESCVVYKFDLGGFDQSEIHLTITNDRVLEIRASKEMRDELGKIYREFKREIHLEPEVDDKLIKNVLHEGILTLKIPKANRPDGLVAKTPEYVKGSVSNAHNLGAPNGFRELYGDDGRLQKLTADFRGFAPENVRIVLSANNVLKVSASQSEHSPSHKGGSVQKECTRHYTLPAWVQPENMKAIMSRDGMLTVEFNSNPGSPTSTANVTAPSQSSPTVAAAINAAAAAAASTNANSKNNAGDRITIN